LLKNIIIKAIPLEPFITKTKPLITNIKLLLGIVYALIGRTKVPHCRICSKIQTKIVERGKIDISSTKIHDGSLSWFGRQFNEKWRG
jgi:hypothetical protein